MGFYADYGKIDPKIYVSGLKKLFMAHSVHAGRRVIDPVQGLPSQLKWLPALAEVAEALAKAEPSEKASERLDRLCRQQISERLALTHRRKSPEERAAFVRSMGADPDRRHHTSPGVDPKELAKQRADELARVRELGNGNIELGYIKLFQEIEACQDQ